MSSSIDVTKCFKGDNVIDLPIGQVVILMSPLVFG